MIGKQLERDGLTNDEILELFRQAQRALIDLIERADPSSPFRSYRVRQVRAIDAVLVRLSGRAQKWAEREIGRLVRAGAMEADEAIRKLDERDFAFDFAGVPEAAVRVLVEDAFLDFGNTIAALRRNATRALMNKRKLQEKIVEGVIQGSSVARTQKQLIEVLRRDGIEVLKARNGFGRRFTLEHYTNMLVRTQSMTAYNLGARKQMLGAGRRFGIVPTIRPDIDGDDVCNDWERKKYVDLLKDPMPPYHPNCRHRVLPVSFEQLKAERPDLYRQAVGFFDEAAA